MHATQRIVNLALAAMLFVGFAPPAVAQPQGDADDRLEDVWPNLDVPPAPVVPPEKAVDELRTAPGFTVELVAAEPLIGDPVAMDWDGDGRLWVVQMRGYMPNVDGDGEGAPIGQVVVLEDTDGDGRMDKSTVFLDQLSLPRAIAVVDGGVLVAEPPHVWYCKDTDGDLLADEKTSVYKGYGTGRLTRSDNGLLRGLDNWIHNAQSKVRFRFDDGKLQSAPSAIRPDWGITQDSHGRLYTNNNNSFLHADLLPARYLLRNPHVPERTGVAEPVVRNQAVHTIRPNTGVTRGYLESRMRNDGRLARCTSACGPMIYRGNQFPSKFRGDAFVAEPAGNVVCCFGLEEKAGGVELKADHRLYDDAKWGKREFLASTDERFRPVNCYNGPDGALYVLDMYRGIIEHAMFHNRFIRSQILDRNLDKPLGLGRIYRVVHEGSKAAWPSPGLSDLPNKKLVPKLDHPNGWWRDEAQQLLVDRDDASVAGKLREMARDGDAPLGRIHALWTLDGLDALDAATALDAMGDPHPKVRIAAIRTAEALLDGSDGKKLLERLLGMTDAEKRSVRLQVMLTFGEAAGKDRVADAMASMLTRDADDRFIRRAALSGLKDREAAFLRRLAERWSEEKPGYARTMRGLAAAVFRSRKPERIRDTLALAAEQAKKGQWRAPAVLDGLLAGADDGKPVKLEEKPAAVETLAKRGGAPVDKRLKKLRNALSWPEDG